MKKTFEVMAQRALVIAEISKVIQKNGANYARAQSLWEETTKGYGTTLQATITRRAQVIVRAHGDGSRFVQVSVTPLVNHIEYTVKPHVRLQWVGPGLRDLAGCSALAALRLVNRSWEPEAPAKARSAAAS